jgi:hypothetical protein
MYFCFYDTIIYVYYVRHVVCIEEVIKVYRILKTLKESPLGKIRHE